MNDQVFLTFGNWLAEAEASEPNDPNAMTLATLSGHRPAARIVLLKAWDERGFVFYTNLDSRKSTEIKANPHAALLFHWKSLRRQIRIEGALALVPDDEADAYYATRPRGSRLGAWASAQSRPLESRAVFEARLAAVAVAYPGADIPRPPFWSGWRLTPDYFEFWQDKEYRLHDRQVFTRTASGWDHMILFP
ncbi:MAG: pyridoxamine 5'-phosphate oxidase [Acidocella sp.]|nr:pyridoxamine 5'-phosphate oxidase [Acidocella sp.]